MTQSFLKSKNSMKNLLRFLFVLVTTLSCSAQDLRLYLYSNAPGFHGDFSGKLDEELVVEVYLENSGKKNLTVITAPKRVLNLDSLKVLYWYGVESLGEQVVVPNPYILRPVVLPRNTLVKVDEIRIPVVTIRKALSAEHPAFEISYEIEKEVAPWLPVWTGELKETISIK